MFRIRQLPLTWQRPFALSYDGKGQEDMCKERRGQIPTRVNHLPEKSLDPVTRAPSWCHVQPFNTATLRTKPQCEFRWKNHSIAAGDYPVGPIVARRVPVGWDWGMLHCWLQRWDEAINKECRWPPEARKVREQILPEPRRSTALPAPWLEDSSLQNREIISPWCCKTLSLW